MYELNNSKKIFLDFDGVIVDSNKFKERSIEKAIFKLLGKNEETIKSLSSEITKLGGKPIKKSDDLKITIKELTKQLEEITVKSILSDKKKNIVKDQNIKILSKTDHLIIVPESAGCSSLPLLIFLKRFFKFKVHFIKGNFFFIFVKKF